MVTFAKPRPGIAPISDTFELNISIYLSEGISNAIFCPKLLRYDDNPLVSDAVNTIEMPFDKPSLHILANFS